MPYFKMFTDIGVQRFTIVLPSIIDVFHEYVRDAKVSLPVISSTDSAFRLKTYLISKNID